MNRAVENSFFESDAFGKRNQGSLAVVFDDPFKTEHGTGKLDLHAIRVLKVNRLVDHMAAFDIGHLDPGVGEPLPYFLQFFFAIDVKREMIKTGAVSLVVGRRRG